MPVRCTRAAARSLLRPRTRQTARHSVRQPDRHRGRAREEDREGSGKARLRAEARVHGEVRDGRSRRRRRTCSSSPAPTATAIRRTTRRRSGTTSRARPRRGWRTRSFSVLALGDTNYAAFCEFGKLCDAAPRGARRAARASAHRLRCGLRSAREGLDRRRLRRSFAPAMACHRRLSDAASGASAAPRAAEAPQGWSRKNPFPARLLANRAAQRAKARARKCGISRFRSQARAWTTKSATRSA